MNVVKANVSTAVVFVIMASMANIVGLMLVDLIVILMEFVKICLKRINGRNMSKLYRRIWCEKNRLAFLDRPSYIGPEYFKKFRPKKLVKSNKSIS